MERKIEFLDTKVGLPTLKIDNNFIYSKYDPIKNINDFWNKNSDRYIKHDSIIIYGLGLGYHVLELLNRIDENFLVYVFDVDDSLYNMIKDTESISKLKSHRNVRLIIGYTKNNMIYLSNLLKLCDNFIIIDSILKVIPKEYEVMKEILRNFQIASIGIEKFSLQMEKCSEENENVESSDISYFIDKYKNIHKPIILVASGPSFDEEITEVLKEHRDRVTIFTVSRSLRALINNGIYPDMFCIIDCQELVYEHIKGIENIEVPMTFLSTASNLAVRNYRGNRYIFYNEDLGQIYTIDTGKSVATAILDIAIKCNTDKIIFVGQDLAYTSEVTHSTLAKCSYDIDVTSDLLVKTESVYGKKISTTEGMKVFKRWIERKIEDNKEIEFFNYSKGAKIKGASVIDKYDFIKLIE